MNDNATHVVSTTDERFETDVMIRSQLGLVVLDFWAEWCGPCRMLGPILEKLAEELQGRITLVKANTDENPRAAQQFSVSGIPAVFAVLDGQVIDSFQGALPESAIREWLDRCFAAESLFQATRRIESEPKEAEARLREMTEGAQSDRAKVALLQLLNGQGRDEESLQLLEELEQRGFLEPECERIKAELELRRFAQRNVGELQAKAESHPDDLQAQYELCEALAGDGRYQEAFEICLSLIERDRKNTGEKARQLMVEVFRVLGDEAELTREYRRKLSMVLY